jgi:hypothetical protein
LRYTAQLRIINHMSRYAPHSRQAPLTFDERLAVGQAHEDRVLDALRERGWHACLYGQRVLDDGVKLTGRTPLRWGPDIVASHGQETVLVDAKATFSRGTRRHAVSADSLRAALQWEAFTGLPLYFVFADLLTMEPREVLAAVVPGRRPRIDDLGGTAFVPAGAGRPFDEVFSWADARTPLPV